ncbi:hypothetical protein EDD99_7161 [Streptomyces sp. 846.5]|nr:hypothetical protein [Streptomyces sp. 846.5]TDT95336.1 hypothetical protein EDD99_7161 [Streptomyces sp. 846.5]
MIDPASIEPTVLPQQLSPRSHKGYPGRAQLDRSNMRMRKAFARLAREGLRDPETAAKIAPIVQAAAEQMDRLAVEADRAADNSLRNRAMLSKEQAKLNKVLRRSAAAGNASAVRMLAAQERA